MTAFRCPKCKQEYRDTIYLKIKSARCTKCHKNMIKLYIPIKEILRQEKLCEKAIQSDNLVTPKLIQTFK